MPLALPYGHLPPPPHCLSARPQAPEVKAPLLGSQSPAPVFPSPAHSLHGQQEPRRPPCTGVPSRGANGVLSQPCPAANDESTVFNASGQAGRPVSRRVPLRVAAHKTPAATKDPGFSPWVMLTKPHPRASPARIPKS